MSTMKENTNHFGLTDEEVRRSRAEHGVNLLTPPKRPSLFKLYLEKFQDPVVKVLLVAANLDCRERIRRNHRYHCRHSAGYGYRLLL